VGQIWKKLLGKTFIVKSIGSSLIHPLSSYLDSDMWQALLTSQLSSQKYVQSDF
jgi:hypothetical protein